MLSGPVFLRPPRLVPGSRVAALSLSSGLVTDVMNRYPAGVTQVAQALEWKVVPAPNALRGPAFLADHPEARADDLHWALTSADIHGMVSIIGGDDSVRLLPFLRPDLIRAHPKALLGFSDTTVTLTQFVRAGVMAYHGPALLTDLAENAGLHPFTLQGVRRALVDPPAPFDLTAAPEWSEAVVPWTDEAAQMVRRPFQPGDGWVWLQGDAPAQGHLLGGCAEVLAMLCGTPGWPDRTLWRGAVLALETSEDVPPPRQVGYWLRNYAAQGILGELAGLLLARPRGYTPGMVQDLYGWVRQVLLEAARPDLPVVANMDFGHTSPQLTLLLGGQVRLDPRAGRVTVFP
ncbi:LD-carboxypeptidase [Deinococcus taeanensis]|uniref:S66 family peptidase n=1 Tax=Deinococcus taeanensis TaxID=2737050 RepID=UPI001CDB8081|nr:S66 peptidase family protein [Deinococcus taeanensis]UBV42253.1 LD-carboxypeptidase [Deinococcus taeanensis]